MVILNKNFFDTIRSCFLKGLKISIGPTEVRVLEILEIARKFSHTFRKKSQTSKLAQLFVVDRSAIIRYEQY